jgi:phosphoserine phosphatase RsbU/P
MEKEDGIDGLSLKLIGILVAFALIPMISIGIISLAEMNQASEDVQSKISNLSTTLNRSALTVASDEADQMQLATAKARQYDEFFKRIRANNELIAGYAALDQENESCATPPGMWVAPIGSNLTIAEKREETIKSLCVPAKIMQSLFESEPFLSLSYIGTEDGVLVTWPYGNEILKNTDPFGYKDKPYYSAAKNAGKTLWTGPYLDENGFPVITITTPIYRDKEFAGISGMDISLGPIYADLSSISGRGYPFIVDGSGRVVMMPRAKPEGSLKNLFESDGLSEANGSEVKKMVQIMLQRKGGSSVIGLGGADAYLAFAPIEATNWSLAMAYPAEEMSLPARFIDSGIKDVAKSAIQGLNDASKNTTNAALLIFALTGAVVLASGILLGRRIDSHIKSLTEAAGKISRGEFDVEVRPSGELASLEMAFNKMARDLKDYANHLEEDAEERGGSEKEIAFTKGIKKNLILEEIPDAEGYDISALYLPSDKDGFDIYDINTTENRISLAMARVDGCDIQAAMLAVMSRALIRASPDRSDPIKTLKDLNSQINQYAHGMNLACFYALLDPSNNVLDYVNAGFNPPFIVDPGGMVDTLGGGGIALGMLDKVDLKSECIPIQKGDVLVVYSNGLTEAIDDNKRQFGTDRLINLIIENRNLAASEIMSLVEADYGDFSQNNYTQSDITLLIIKQN